MAISVVQITATIDSTGYTGTVYLSTSTPVVGNRIIASAWAYAAGDPSFPNAPTDDATGGSNTYARDVWNYAGSPQQGTLIASGKVDRTKSSLGVTIVAANGVMAGAAMEVSGIATSSPLDQAAAVDVTYGGSSPNVYWDVTVPARSEANELVVAVASYPATDYGSYALALGAWGSYTPTQWAVNDSNPVNSEYGQAGYAIATGTESFTARFTANSAGSEISPTIVATYREAPSLSGPHTRNYSPDAMGMRTVLRM
jgi:hypothetical protein